MRTFTCILVLAIAIPAFAEVTRDETYGYNNATGQAIRLVHDGEKVLALIDGTDSNVTSAAHKIEEFKTQSEVMLRIDKLGLEYRVTDIVDVFNSFTVNTK